jgi:hypothetical protein
LQTFNQLTASKEAGLFVQDTFKITPRLTVDYGLRWDYYGLPYITSKLSYRWDPTTGNVVVDPSVLTQASPLYPKSINLVGGQVVPDAKLSNIRPRVAAAYRLGRDMVIRGGYAEFTERFGISDRATSGGPFGIAENYTNVNQPGIGPLFSFPNPFPASLSLAASPSQSVTGYPTKTDNGVIRQFNATVEQVFAKDFGFRLSYIGSRGSRLNYQANINKPQPGLVQFTPSRNPYPQFNSIKYWLSNGSTRYNALQVEVQRRTGWFTFDGHYTWASNLYNYGDTENPYDITSHWSHDSTTRRHYAVINTGIELPFGRGRRYMNSAPGWVDGALGGWSLQTISYFGSGMYFTPLYSGSDASNTNTFGGIPDRVPNVSLYPAHQGVRSWFNPAAFTKRSDLGRLRLSEEALLLNDGKVGRIPPHGTSLSRRLKALPADAPRCSPLAPPAWPRSIQ